MKRFENHVYFAANESSKHEHICKFLTTRKCEFKTHLYKNLNGEYIPGFGWAKLSINIKNEDVDKVDKIIDKLTEKPKPKAEKEE